MISRHVKVQLMAKGVIDMQLKSGLNTELFLRGSMIVAVAISLDDDGWPVLRTLDINRVVPSCAMWHNEDIIIGTDEGPLYLWQLNNNTKQVHHVRGARDLCHSEKSGIVVRGILEPPVIISSDQVTALPELWLGYPSCSTLIKDQLWYGFRHGLVHAPFGTFSIDQPVLKIFSMSKDRVLIVGKQGKLLVVSSPVVHKDVSVKYPILNCALVENTLFFCAHAGLLRVDLTKEEPPILAFPRHNLCAVQVAVIDSSQVFMVATFSGALEVFIMDKNIEPSMEFVLENISKQVMLQKSLVNESMRLNKIIEGFANLTSMMRNEECECRLVFRMLDVEYLPQSPCGFGGAFLDDICNGRGVLRVELCNLKTYESHWVLGLRIKRSHTEIELMSFPFSCISADHSGMLYCDVPVRLSSVLPIEVQVCVNVEAMINPNCFGTSRILLSRWLDILDFAASCTPISVIQNPCIMRVPCVTLKHNIDGCLGSLAFHVVPNSGGGARISATTWPLCCALHASLLRRHSNSKNGIAPPAPLSELGADVVVSTVGIQERVKATRGVLTKQQLWTLYTEMRCPQ